MKIILYISVFVGMSFSESALSSTQCIEVCPKGALFSAIEVGDLEAVQAVLEKGVNIEERGENRQTALHYASFWGNLEAVRALLSAGADIEAEDKDGQTPLDLAIQESHFSIAHLLKDD